MNESTQPKAKKSLGQHFLRHESICNRIASLLLPKDTDNVIEIGPGPGWPSAGRSKNRKVCAGAPARAHA